MQIVEATVSENQWAIPATTPAQPPGLSISALTGNRNVLFFIQLSVEFVSGSAGYVDVRPLVDGSDIQRVRRVSIPAAGISPVEFLATTRVAAGQHTFTLDIFSTTVTCRFYGTRARLTLLELPI